jgi:uncharacterized damage-inducible protein DinB
MTTTQGEIAGEYLAEARGELALCHKKIRHCIEQLNDEQIWWRAGEEFNSIANLLLHLIGNISQRIVSLVGGEPDRRDRDQEFSARGPIAKAELMARFEEVIRRADAVLAAVAPEQLLESRRYRMLKGEVEGTVLKLILQTLVHVGGHTQEIVALTRSQLRDRYRFMQTPQPSIAKH